MTEYELGEMLYNTYENLWNSAQMYFTLVSAYLITGYLVGAKLTTQQNKIVTVRWPHSFEQLIPIL